MAGNCIVWTLVCAIITTLLMPCWMVDRAKKKTPNGVIHLLRMLSQSSLILKYFNRFQGLGNCSQQQRLHTSKRNIIPYGTASHQIAEVPNEVSNDHTAQFGQFESSIFHAPLHRFVVLASHFEWHICQQIVIYTYDLFNWSPVSKMNHPKFMRTHTEKIHLMCACARARLCVSFFLFTKWCRE